MRARPRRLGLAAALVGLACGSGETPDTPGAAAPVQMPSAVDVVAAVPRPQDAAVLRLGTPASSEDARPSFATGSGRYAPPAGPEVARTLFAAADGAARQGASFDRDLAACRVVQHGESPGLRRRDRRRARLSVTLAWGEARHTVASAPSSGPGETCFVVPLLAMQRGDPWSVSVRSGDDDHELSGVFDGTMPWRARAGDLELECRAVDPGARAEAVRDALWGLDRKLALLSITSSSNAHASLRDIERFLDPVADAAEPVAALVGWDDPRLARRFVRRAELEARLLDALAADRAEALARAAEPGAWVGVGRMGRRLEVKADAMTCEIAEAAGTEPIEPHEAWRCEVTLSIDNGARGDRSLDAAGDLLVIGGAAITFADRFGRLARVRWPGEGAPASIERAAVLTTRLVLEPTVGDARLHDEPSPSLPVAFELVSERRRHRLFAPAKRPRRLGKLPRPRACDGPSPPAVCTGG